MEPNSLHVMGGRTAANERLFPGKQKFKNDQFVLLPGARRLRPQVSPKSVERDELITNY